MSALEIVVTNPLPDASSHVRLPDRSYVVAKRTIEGATVFVSRRKARGRGLELIDVHSRALCKGEIHELIVTDETEIGPGVRVANVAYIGFLEIATGGVCWVGDRVLVGDRYIGNVAGFDLTHFPNHLNICIASAERFSGEDLGIDLGSSIRFVPLGTED